MHDRPSPYGYYDPEPSLPLKQPICIIGFMGSESHTVAALLSSLTGQPLIDLDDWVEHEAGQSLASLYQQRGASAWRTLELRGLSKALSAARPSVISLGDGVLLSSEASALQRRSSQLIYVKRPLPQLYEGLLKVRSAKPSRLPYWAKRPPQSMEELEPLLSARQIAYDQADVTIEAGSDAPLSVARALAARLQVTGRLLTLSLLSVSLLFGCDPAEIGELGPAGGVSLMTYDAREGGEEGTSAAPPSQEMSEASSTGGQALTSSGSSPPEPPPEPPLEPEPATPDEQFDACVHELDERLNERWEAACSTYPMNERIAQGPYNEEPVIGVCLQLSCSGIDLEGHNGLMIGRSCYDLDLLRQVLSAAAEDANEEGGCIQPQYSLNIVPLDQRMIGEPCDAIVCQIQPDGLFTRSEN